MHETMNGRARRLVLFVQRVDFDILRIGGQYTPEERLMYMKVE